MDAVGAVPDVAGVGGSVVASSSTVHVCVPFASTGRRSSVAHRAVRWWWQWRRSPQRVHGHVRADGDPHPAHLQGVQPGTDGSAVVAAVSAGDSRLHGDGPRNRPRLPGADRLPPVPQRPGAVRHAGARDRAGAVPHHHISGRQPTGAS
eukprot:ctg_410.g218